MVSIHKGFQKAVLLTFLMRQMIKPARLDWFWRSVLRGQRAYFELFAGDYESCKGSLRGELLFKEDQADSDLPCVNGTLLETALYP